MIKDSGERTEFASGAVRDMSSGKGRFDLLPWHAIHEVARHCEEGAKKYGERNVDKGIPQHSFVDSAIRHLVRYIHNEQDEPHLRAAAWNVLWALEQTITRPELDDLPNRQQEEPRIEDLREACEAMKQSEAELFDTFKMLRKLFGDKVEITVEDDVKINVEDTDDEYCPYCEYEDKNFDEFPCKECKFCYTNKFKRKEEKE